MHSGHIIVEKSDYEYRLRPAAGCCSIFNFTKQFYDQLIHDYDLQKSFFFCNANLLSLLLVSSPEADYLHYQIMKSVGTAGKLEMDSLVLGLVQQITATITDRIFEKELSASLRKNHVSTIEKAKEYINENFRRHLFKRSCRVLSYQPFPLLQDVQKIYIVFPASIFVEY